MRYSGSKRRFMKELSPIIMEYINNRGKNTLFVDAFCGGANVISCIPHPYKIGIELNQYVCALWNHIKKNGMEGIPMSISKEEYYRVKEDYVNNTGQYPMWYIGYVGSCCSYGGAWWGGYANYNPNKNEDHIGEAYRGLCKQVKDFKYLDTTKFINASYDGVKLNNNNIIIYCDPPYANTKGYKDKFDSDKFWQWARNASGNGITVLVSEYQAPNDFKCIWSSVKSDGMAQTVGKRQERKVEKLFTIP